MKQIYTASQRFASTVRHPDSGALQFQFLHGLSHMNLGVYIQVPFLPQSLTTHHLLLRHLRFFETGLYSPYADSSPGFSTSSAAAAAEGPIRQSRRQPRRRHRLHIWRRHSQTLEPLELARMLDAIRASFTCSFREDDTKPNLRNDHFRKNRRMAGRGHQSGQPRYAIFQRSRARRLRPPRLPRRHLSLRGNSARLAPQNFSFDLIAGLPHQTSDSMDQLSRRTDRARPEHFCRLHARNR